jgi:hypothetical protein
MFESLLTRILISNRPPPHNCGQLSEQRLYVPVGCPRNNQISFSVLTETNRNPICFGCFSVCFSKPKNIFFGLLWFVSVFRISIKTTETNTTLSKQTEKSLKNVFYIRGSSKQLIFVFLGSNRNKPKINLFRLFFGLSYAKPNNFFFGLFWCIGPLSKQPKQTELQVWGIKKVHILTNLLLFRLVFCLFRLF